jgi:hypothetical protein
MQVWPDRVEQLVLGHQFAGALDETAQYLKRLRRQHDPVIPAPEQSVSPIKPKRPKRNLGCFHGCRSSQSALNKA